MNDVWAAVSGSPEIEARRMNARASQQYFLTALILLSVIFFFYRLGSVPLIGPDEPRYAQVAREMLERGDLITPTIGGQLWAEKPILPYWLMMIGMWLLGVTEWAARLPSAVLATLAAIAVYYTGTRLVSSRLGFLSALVLIVSVMFTGFAHGASTDMPLAAMITLGLCCYLLFEAGSDRRSRWWMLAAYGWFGLAVLAKGLVGIILPGAIIGGYLLLTGQIGKIRSLRLWPGMLVFLAVASIWYVPVIMRHGWEFINEFFISHHFQRFTTDKFRHPGPIYYYLPVILVGIFPWTAFLISSLFRFRWPERKARTPHERLQWFCLVWIVVPLVFFSLSGSKLPGYILPALPATAFLAASELERLLRTGMDRALKWSIYLTPALIAAVGITGVIYAGREIQPPAVANAMIFLATGFTVAAFLFSAMTKRFGAAVASIVLGCAVGVTLINHFYLPRVTEKESRRALAEMALREMRPGERIAGYHYYHHSLTFYTHARSFYDGKGNVVIARSPEELLERAREEGSLLCVTREALLEGLLSHPELHIRRLGQQRDTVLVRVMSAGVHQQETGPSTPP